MELSDDGNILSDTTDRVAVYGGRNAGADATDLLEPGLAQQPAELVRARGNAADQVLDQFRVEGKVNAEVTARGGGGRNGEKC
jgi:hypothetical protein